MIGLHLKKLLLLFVLFFFITKIFSQDVSTLLRVAKNLEFKFDETGAIAKYQEVVGKDPSNMLAMVKCTELNCSIGNREKDKNTKKSYYQSALIFAQNAYAKDSSNSDACYARALVAKRMSEIDDNKDLIEDIKQIKIFSDKALAANVNNAKANYILGTWHFELIRSNWIKKQQVKSFYRGISDTQIDSAIYYMEKARTIEPYFAIDFLDLAKVYAYDHQPEKAIDVLNKLVHLPNRTYDDTAIKEEGKQMLATIQ